MKRWSPVCLLTAVLVCTAVASATTVIPPTFDELVSQAETIFVGRAVDSRSEFDVSAGGRSIVTHITFSVERVLKGRVGPLTELTFQGGTVGDLRMDIADMPRFQIGDRDVLFVSSEQRTISPLVGFSYGRFRLVRDSATGGDQVRTHDGRPIASTAELGRPYSLALQSVRPMLYTEFESAVRSRMNALGVR